MRDGGLAAKVDVIRAPVNSPVLATYQFVENKDDSPELAQPGDLVIPGCSTKGGDEVRFQADFEKYAREGVQIADPIDSLFSVLDVLRPLIDYLGGRCILTETSSG